MDGIELKQEGIDRAKRAKKEMVAAARRHLVEVAITRHDLRVTADDARQWADLRGLSLGNAAGSLFAQRWWIDTGDREASSYASNHAHANRVWRLEPALLPDEWADLLPWGSVEDEERARPEGGDWD